MIWRAHPRSQPTDEDYRLDIGNGQHLQILDCTAGDDRIAVAIVPLGLDGFDRIEAVRRFLSALPGRAIPPDTRLTRQQQPGVVCNAGCASLEHQSQVEAVRAEISINTYY